MIRTDKKKKSVEKKKGYRDDFSSPPPLPPQNTQLRSLQASRTHNRLARIRYRPRKQVCLSANPMLKNALRRTKLSSSATSGSPPFVCLFCAKHPSLSRSLSTTLPVLKTPAKSDADLEAAATSKLLLDELRKDIMGSAARKRPKESKSRLKAMEYRRKALEEAKGVVEEEEEGVKKAGKKKAGVKGKKGSEGKKKKPKAKGGKTKGEGKKKPQAASVRRVNAELASVGGVEGMSLATAMGVRPKDRNMEELDPDTVNVERMCPSPL